MKVFKSSTLSIKLMKYVVKIEVSLKLGHSNPEGETTAHLLKELGYQVEKVDVSKVYIVTLNASSLTEAEVAVEEMSKRLLVNPTKDNYTINVVVEQ
jgi:phosphoribosylformylglycinamidine synthase PurS subunit